MGRQMAFKIGAVGYWECSAKANRGIDLIFEVAAKEAFKAVREGLTVDKRKKSLLVSCVLPCTYAWDRSSEETNTADR